MSGRVSVLIHNQDGQEVFSAELDDVGRGSIRFNGKPMEKLNGFTLSCGAGKLAELQLNARPTVMKRDDS